IQRRKRRAFGAAYLAVPKTKIRTIIRESSLRPPPVRARTGRTKEAHHGSLLPLVSHLRTSGAYLAAPRPGAHFAFEPRIGIACAAPSGKCHRGGTGT